MSVNRGLEQGELEGLLHRPDLTDNLFRVAWYSMRTFKEAAMAVYKDPNSGELTVSEPLYADPENQALEYQDYTRASEQAYTSICDVDLLHSEYQQRRDVSLLLHSHISLPRENIDP